MMGATGELCIDSMAATRLDGARSRDVHDPIARSAFEGRALSESVSTLDLSQRHAHRGAERGRCLRALRGHLARRT